VENARVVQWGKNWVLKGVREEGVLVGRLEAADQRLQLLLLTEVPVQEAQIAIWQI
jgi:hypothetical protein